MIEKKIKYRLRKNSDSPDDSVKRQSFAQLPEQHISMVGVRVQGHANSGESKRQFSARPFLPAEVGRKNLVQSPRTASRNEFLKRARQAREAEELSSPEPDDGKLPAIKDTLLIIKGPRERENTKDSQERLKLPKLKRTSPKDASRCSPSSFTQSNFCCPSITEAKSRRLPEISKGLSCKEALPKLPDLKAKQNNFMTNSGRNGGFAGIEERQRCLKQRKQMFLPNLNQNCELSTNGSIMENSYMNDSFRQSRRGSRRIRSGQKSASERRREIALSSPMEVLPFEDELVGKSCPKSRREKQRQKSGLPSLKTNF